MNTFPGLTWEFEDPSDKVNFMDLTITIQNGHISTSLFEKPLNLHIYIYIYLLTLPIHLGSSPASSTVHYFEFSPSARITTTGSYAQGCVSNDCMPVVIRVTKLNHSFTKQYHEPNNTLDQQTRQKNNHNSVIFHLPFHPNDPPSYKIQQAWRETTASPRYHMPLPNMRNLKTIEKCNIERMIIAYVIL